MVSLLHLADITEAGVTFQSPVDGTSMLLTPEHSMAIQNQLGADIMMALDDVVSSVNVNRERFREATARTTRWIDRCVTAHKRPHEQNLFAIIQVLVASSERCLPSGSKFSTGKRQTAPDLGLPCSDYAYAVCTDGETTADMQGGLDAELRSESLRDLTARDLPGYAIGGLAGGEDKDSFWRVVAQCTAALPRGKPRYVMGIGYPVDIVVCSALGADMYDSVFPTRTARFGVALTRFAGGLVKLKKRGHEGVGHLLPAHSGEGTSQCA